MAYYGSFKGVKMRYIRFDFDICLLLYLRWSLLLNGYYKNYEIFCVIKASFWEVTNQVLTKSSQPKCQYDMCLKFHNSDFVSLYKRVRKS